MYYCPPDQKYYVPDMMCAFGRVRVLGGGGRGRKGKEEQSVPWRLEAKNLQWKQRGSAQSWSLPSLPQTFSAYPTEMRYSYICLVIVELLINSVSPGYSLLECHMFPQHKERRRCKQEVMWQTGSYMLRKHSHNMSMLKVLLLKNIIM